MTDAGGEGLADLNAPILDDRLYRAQALLLQDGQNEDQLDAQLAVAARESGIEDPDVFLMPAVLDSCAAAMSTMSLQSEQRSSASVHSRETQSSAFTSLPSRTSRDKSPISRATPPLVRTSFFLDENDALSDGPRSTTVRGRSSMSGLSTPISFQSHMSRTSSVRVPGKKARRRASGLFSMFRKDSQASTCSSISHHSHHSKPQSPKLECGHSLSKYAIRVHVQEALESKTGITPNCCGRPLPRDVLGIVLTNAEVDLVTDDILPSPDTLSLGDSAYSENGISSVDLPRILHTDVLIAEPSTMPPSPTDVLNELDEARLSYALESESFQMLKTQQRQEYKRIAAFEANQRKALSINFQNSLKRLAAQLELSKTEKAKQHVQQLERLEEFQLRMEHDLRNTHTTETQNVATALKHMEAYCQGPNPAHTGIDYKVTEEDLKKLDRQRTIQEKLPAKHDSAINVLRAKQERDTTVKFTKQEAELEQLEMDHDKEKRAKESQYVEAVSQLDALIQTRRGRTARRWDLKFEIWRRTWERETGTALLGRLPHEDWPETTDAEIEIEPAGAMARYVDVAA